MAKNDGGYSGVYSKIVPIPRNDDNASPKGNGARKSAFHNEKLVSRLDRNSDLSGAVKK
jgi:hypothetical protein